MDTAKEKSLKQLKVFIAVARKTVKPKDRSLKEKEVVSQIAIQLPLAQVASQANKSQLCLQTKISLLSVSTPGKRCLSDKYINSYRQHR